MYKAIVNVTLRQSILDPQGKATHQALQNLGMNEVKKVRIGKQVLLDIDAASHDRAKEIAEKVCTQVLANEVMEDFTVTIDEK